jgi:hypothetical protein
LIKNKEGGCWGPANGNSMGEVVIYDLVSFHLRKKRIRLEKGCKLPEINSL